MVITNSNTNFEIGRVFSTFILKSLPLFLIFISIQLFSQSPIDLGCRSVEDNIGLDRKCWTTNSGELSESWQLDFQIPPAPELCVEITGIDVDISFSGDFSGVPSGCWFDWWTNVSVGCGGFSPCDCPGPGSAGLIYDQQGYPSSQSLGNPGNFVQFGDLISVDIVAVVEVLDPLCPGIQDAITQGLVTGSFSICVRIHYGPSPINVPVDLGPDDLVCFGETILLDANGPYTDWLWSDSSTNPTLTAGPGTYTVQVTDSNGCTDTDEIEITENPEMFVSFDRPDPYFICEGDTEIITASASGGNGGGYQYAWTSPLGNPSSSNMIVTDSDGLFTITVTDGNNCTKESDIMVSYFDDPVAMINTPDGLVFCEGSSLNLEGVASGGSGSGYTYEWTGPSFNSTNQNESINVDGTYELVVTDGNGCISDVAQVVITKEIPPNPGTSDFIEVCNDEMSFDVESFLGTHDGGGVWSDVNGSGVNISDMTNVDFTSLSAGVFNFLYTVTGTPPCMDGMANIEITIVEKAEIGMDASVSFCGNEGPLDFMDLTGNINLVGQWIELSSNQTAADISDPFNVDISTLTSGTYVFEYFVRPDPPCNPAINTLTIEIEQEPNAGSALQIMSNVCLGSTVDLFDFLTDNPDTTGVWSNVNGANVDITNPDAVDFSNVAEGIYDFSYVVSGNICSFTSEATISLNVSQIDAGLSPDSLVCSTDLLLDLNQYITGSLGGIFIGENLDTLFNGILDSMGVPGQTYNIEYVLEATGQCPESRDTFSFVFADALAPTELSFSYCDDPNQSITVGNDTYDINNPSGTTVLKNNEGCDSLVSVIIEFNESSPVTMVTESHCQDDGFVLMVGTESFDQSNPVGSVTLSNENNCDSLVEVRLSFIAPVFDSIVERRCKDDGYSVTVGSETFDQNNTTGTVTLMSSQMCDSIVDVKLTFLDELFGEYTREECQGSGFTITIGNQIFDESNPTGSATIVSSLGCDSIVDVRLDFIEALNTPFSSQECEGNGFSLVVGNETFDEFNPTGSVTLQSSTGCDSIIEVQLDFNPIYNIPIEESRCKNDGYSIVVGTEIFNESNSSGTVILQTENGCDSIITVNLNYTDAIVEDIISQQCLGDGSSVTVGNEVFNETNPTGSVTLTSSSGCDSIVNVMLNYSSSLMSEIDLDQCAGNGFSIMIENEIFDESNPSGSVTLTSMSGCDSIVSVSLNFVEASMNNITEQRCQGDGFVLIIGNDTYSENNPSGQTVLASANANGCDSVVTVSLDYSSSTIMEFVGLEVCDDDFEISVGNDIYNINNPSGTTTVEGSGSCDSIYTIDIVFNSQVESTIQNVLCENETMMIGGEIISPSNNPSQIILTSNSPQECDTILNLDIQFLQTTSSTMELNICDGDSVFLENDWQFTSGTYVDLFLNAENCDSVVMTTLNVQSCAIDFAIIPSNISCFGLSDGKISFEIITASTYPYTIRLLDSGSNLVAENFLMMDGGVIIFENLSSDQYELELLDANGDVVLSQSITLIQPDLLELMSTVVDVSCFGEANGSFVLTTSGGTPGYTYDDPNIVNDESGNLPFGTYNIQVTDQNGCTASTIADILQPLDIEYILNPSNPSCNQPNGSIQISDITGGNGNYQVSLNNQDFSDNMLFENLNAGEYTVEIRDQNLCSKLIEGIVLEDVAGLNLAIEFSEPEFIYNGTDPVSLDPIIDFVPTFIEWSPAEGLSCTDCLNPEATPEQSQWYYINLENEAGCSETDSVFVRRDFDNQIYIPDSFSPNNDGINDNFILGFKNAISYSMEIYDRWGNKVFGFEDKSSDDAETHWDGRYNDRSLEPGVYIYKLKINLINEEEYYDGHLTLVR